MAAVMGYVAPATSSRLRKEACQRWAWHQGQQGTIVTDRLKGGEVCKPALVTVMGYVVPAAKSRLRKEACQRWAWRQVSMEQ